MTKKSDIIHDKLCPPYYRNTATDTCDGCSLISQVRADEREAMEAQLLRWFTHQGMGVIEVRRALGVHA